MYYPKKMHSSLWVAMIDSEVAEFSEPDFPRNYYDQAFGKPPTEVLKCGARLPKKAC